MTTATETETKQKPPATKQKVRLFRLSDIPGVMRTRMGWPVAAALMDRWFAFPPFEIDDNVKQGRVRLSSLSQARLDENIVKMSWALGFARVQTGVKSLVAQSQWASKNGLALLSERVNRQSVGRRNSCWHFGDLSKPARVIHETCQVNFMTLGSLSDPLDDFYGAMGEAQLTIAVSGMVTTDAQGKHSLEVKELGLYLRDTYDFNDRGVNRLYSQPLGFWGFSGVDRSAQLRWDVEIEEKWVEEDAAAVRAYKYQVQNADFRRWRTRFQRGGDFMVLSDVLRIPLGNPITIAL